MKTTPSVLAALAATASLLAPGCSSGPPETAEEIDEALVVSYGGLSESDEEPAFGEAEIAALGVEDVPAEDGTLEGDPDVVAAEADTTTPAAHLRVLLLWGRLLPMPGATTSTDWTGTIRVTGGAVRALRLVAFEAPGDRLVVPRPDIRTVEVSSATTTSADGLLLDVVIHPLIDPAGTPITVTFDAPAATFTHTLSLAAGERSGGHVSIGDTNDSFAWEVLAPSAGDCGEGILTGRWTQAGTILGRPVGLVKGRWLDDRGALGGTLRGIWGKRRSGSKVFFAKLIDVDGVFAGLLAGHHEAHRFAGLVLGPGKQIEGLVRGAYWEGLASTSRGFFEGRWSRGCGEAPDEGGWPEDDEDTPAAL